MNKENYISISKVALNTICNNYKTKIRLNYFVDFTSLLMKHKSFLVILSLIIALATQIIAQENGYVQPRVNGEADGTVNLFTGRLNVNIPVISVSGRGEVNTGLNAVNRGQSDFGIYESSRVYHPTTGQLSSINYITRGGDYDAPHYKSDYLPMSLSFKTTAGLFGASWIASGPVSSYLTLTTSSGDEIHFRDSLRDGEPTELNPYSANGPVVQCGVFWNYQFDPNGPPPAPPTPPPSYCLRGKVFHSTDGSAMTYISDDNIYDGHYYEPSDPFATVNYIAFIEGTNNPNLGTNGYLYMSNGVKYRIHGGVAVWMIDRNGNRITFTYEKIGAYSNALCDGSQDEIFGACRINKITDSLNREVEINYGTPNDNGFFDTFTYKGFAGSQREIKIHYNRMVNALYPGETLKYGYELFPIPTINVPPGNNVTEGEKKKIERYLDKYRKISGEESTTIEQRYNPIVMSHVIAPDGQVLQFKYNSYGEIARTIASTGSYTDYIYGALPNPSECNPSPIANNPTTQPNGLVWITVGNPSSPYQIPSYIHRRVTESIIYDSSNVIQNKKTFSNIGRNGPVELTIRNNNNSILQRSKHYFLNTCQDWLTYFDNWKENREYKTEIYENENAINPIRITETTWENNPLPWLGNHPIAIAENASYNPRISEIKTTLETGLITRTAFNYDQYNNVTDIHNYDYGNGQVGALIRRAHASYITDPIYTDHTGPHLRRLASEKWVSSDSEGNNKVSLVRFERDKYTGTINHAPLLTRNNVSQHNSLEYNVSNILRGNVTAVTSYADAQNQTGEITIYSQYDILGNPVKVVDAKGSISDIDYDDKFGSPDGEARDNISIPELEGKSTFGFGTKGINSKGWNTYAQYDYYTSSVVNTEDMNGKVDSIFYNDDLDRKTQKITAYNIPEFRRQSSVTYDDLNRKIKYSSDLSSFNDNLFNAEIYYDEFGRNIESRKYNNDSNFTVIKTEYDAMGRVARTTSPYSPPLNEIEKWTETKYDNLNREIELKAVDGTVVSTSYSGNSVTVTDQAGRKRRSIINTQGKIERLDEPNTTGDLGSISSPTQPTYYKYNANDNLVEIEQGIQKRFFLFDSLGRLTRVKHPEQDINLSLNLSGFGTSNTEWTAGFLYDENDNVVSVTDSKGITVSSTYDELDRVENRTYSDNTPAVTFTYDDPTVPFSKGMRTQSSNSVSTTKITAFNQMGAVISSDQITDGTTYSSSYEYNLIGVLTKEIYPNGRVINYNLDNNGDLSSVVGRLGATSKIYVDSFTYSSAGKIEKLRLGNNLWESAKFNDRQQLIELDLGTAGASTDYWKVNFEYGEIQNDGTVNFSKNTGNIAKQIISLDGITNNYLQNYKYDSLDRLTEAKETVNQSQTWIQEFEYDRYGNRTSFNEIVDSIQTPNNNITNPSIDINKNRFTTGQGYQYDFNGNIIADAEGRQFTFDGNNKQVEVRDSSSNIVGQYHYDGEGNRVKKVTSTETIVYVYAAGRLVAEYSTLPPPQSNYGTKYLTEDHVGNIRVISGQNGDIISRRDFMPYGEELYAGTTNRRVEDKYSSPNDNVDQKFTGYKRDQETGLDYAQARYYKNRHGRFTAVDPLITSGRSIDPQTFNRYVYVGNNPVIRTDPSGLDWVRSKAKDKNGNYIYKDAYGDDLKSLLATGDYDLFDFGTSSTAVIILDGVPDFIMFRTGGGRDIRPAKAESAGNPGVRSLVDGFHSKYKASLWRIAYTAPLVVVGVVVVSVTGPTVAVAVTSKWVIGGLVGVAAAATGVAVVGVVFDPVTRTSPRGWKAGNAQEQTEAANNERIANILQENCGCTVEANPGEGANGQGDALITSNGETFNAEFKTFNTNDPRRVYGAIVESINAQKGLGQGREIVINIENTNISMRAAIEQAQFALRDFGNSLNAITLIGRDEIYTVTTQYIPGAIKTLP